VFNDYKTHATDTAYSTIDSKFLSIPEDDGENEEIAKYFVEFSKSLFNQKVSALLSDELGGQSTISVKFIPYFIHLVVYVDDSGWGECDCRTTSW
jgi:hypothetical protein